MTLFPDLGGDPRAAVARRADVLAWYGAVGDAIVGNSPGFALRKASLALDLCEIAQVPQSERDAVYFAGLLHTCGAVGNAAYRRGEKLSERIARMESWDVPAQGARFCETVAAALPPETPDMVRWQAECWDGTGHPDQLRWHGIPVGAQMLGLADTFLRNPDPEDALGFIGLQSGRAFSPDAARTFTMWFHTNAAEVTIVTTVPLDLMHDAGPTAAELLSEMADRIDAHNGTSERWHHIEELALGAAAKLGLDAESTASLAIATRLFGSGEVSESTGEHEDLDPLARLGIERRAKHAARAADLAESYDSLRAAAAVIRARAEWFDGTGKPNGLRHGDIPLAAGILAASIAYARLDRSERLDTAAGTQFDPKVVRALIESAKAHA